MTRIERRKMKKQLRRAVMSIEDKRERRKELRAGTGCPSRGK